MYHPAPADDDTDGAFAVSSRTIGARIIFLYYTTSTCRTGSSSRMPFLDSAQLPKQPSVTYYLDVTRLGKIRFFCFLFSFVFFWFDLSGYFVSQPSIVC